MRRPLYPPGHTDFVEGDLAVCVNVGRDNGGIDGHGVMPPNPRVIELRIRNHAVGQYVI